MFRDGHLLFALGLLRGRRQCRSKGAQSSSGHNLQLIKSFVCRFWLKHSLSRDIYPKGNIDVPCTTFCPFGCHHHKRGKIVARRDWNGISVASPVQSSWLLCAVCGKLSGRFLRSFHNHFQGRNLLVPFSAAMLLTASRCAHSLFLQPKRSRTTSDSGTTPAKAAGSKKTMLEKILRWREGKSPPNLKQN